MATKVPPTWSGVARAPIMRMAVPFVLGIMWSMGFSMDLRKVAIALAVVTLSAIIVLRRRSSFRRRWRRWPVIAIWFFLFGIFWQEVRDPLQHPLHLSVEGEQEQLWAVQLMAINGITDKVVRTDADVRGVQVEGSFVPRNGKMMLTLMRQEGGRDPVAGDEVLVRTRMVPITRIPDPGGFDRRSWAASRGMYHECFAEPEQWVIAGHSWRWTDLFEGTRQKVSGWLEESGMPFRERAMVKALVLGMRDELDGEQRNAFVRSGTIHVLAVSGTHVGFIYLMLLFMLQWWGGGRNARIVRGLAVLLALWCYAGLTGACPSVLRATIMFSLFTLAGMTSARADSLNSLFVAGFLLLIWEPHMLVEIGFQLSFLAVLGIILFHAPLERIWVPNNKWVGRIWTLCVMSITAQLLTTPLTLYLFEAFPVYFLPANLFVVTAAGVAVYGAVGLLVLFRLPFIGPLLGFLLMALLMCVGHVTTFFANLPGAYPAVRIGKPEVIILYALVISMALLLMFKWRPGLRYAVASAALLMVIWGMRARESKVKEVFTVYDDRHALNAAITVGRSLVVLTDDDIEADGSWMRKKVDRHQRRIGSGDPVPVRTKDLRGTSMLEVGGTMLGGGRWASTGIDVLFFTEDDPLLQPSDTVDVLVLHDLRYIDEDVLSNLGQRTHQVVLAGEMAWKARSFVKQWCADHALPFHDVRDQGAFVFAK